MFWRKSTKMDSYDYEEEKGKVFNKPDLTKEGLELRDGAEPNIQLVICVACGHAIARDRAMYTTEQVDAKWDRLHQETYCRACAPPWDIRIGGRYFKSIPATKQEVDMHGVPIDIKTNAKAK